MDYDLASICLLLPMYCALAAVGVSAVVQVVRH